jgi:hypothetical protein
LALLGGNLLRITAEPLDLGSSDGWKGGKKYASANATTFFSGSNSTASTKRMLSLSYNYRTSLINFIFLSLHEKGFERLVPQTAGDLPATLTVATETAISAADNGSKGWLLWALVMIGIPAYLPSSRKLVRLKHGTN